MSCHSAYQFRFVVFSRKESVLKQYMVKNQEITVEPFAAQLRFAVSLEKSQCSISDTSERTYGGVHGFERCLSC
jgi:hypothetical protein